jgi:hypothetical protein
MPGGARFRAIKDYAQVRGQSLDVSQGFFDSSSKMMMETIRVKPTSASAAGSLRGVSRGYRL